MKANRIIIALVAVIVVLILVLVIKIITTTDEPISVSNTSVGINDISDITNNKSYTSSDISNLVTSAQDAVNNIGKVQKNMNTDYNDIIGISTVKSMFSKFIVAGVLLFIFIIAYYLIYIKLGIPGILLKINIALYLLSIASVFLNANNILIIVLAILYGVSVIIIKIFELRILGIPPWLLLFVLIPYVGSFVALIINLWSSWRLGEYFNRGTGFKIGMILLAPIFIPILAFSKE